MMPNLCDRHIRPSASLSSEQYFYCGFGVPKG